MKKTAIFLILSIIIFSCNEPYKTRETVSIKLEKFKIDSSSIRAIEIINDSSVVYAGSRGDIGIISSGNKIALTNKIITDTIVPHFRSLAFNKENVYALSVGNPALLYQYANNGIELVYKEEDEKVFYDCMKFFDELNGIAIGDPTEDCLSIIITRDGGNTWGKISCEELPEIKDGEAAFAASNTNIAVYGENAWVVTGGLRARVFHTSDMGLTWEVYNTPIIQGKNTTGIYTVDFYNESQGIICGGDYLDKFGNSTNKAITNNGGETWEVVSKNLEPKYVSCVQYVPNTQGKELFAVSTNGIFFSNDTGLTWKKVNDEGFYSIRVVDENNAFLSGHEVIASMKIK